MPDRMACLLQNHPPLSAGEPLGQDPGLCQFMCVEVAGC